ncbi:ArnT family glycosyltransferase [Terriglobus roseus]|uniref:4-amino-4-deoxy-L-arabinose transferase n=1 Tax=Terriglobus roseus TaxID=392734 RepID=A0A1G7FWJ0_9BACT|nr:glycosyltransferase family 39 protein [Terriglobus roseus]SDE80241.1 4-amino-4-deoxy-L-arabinose transferase [Terriglobus roseus]
MNEPIQNESAIPPDDVSAQPLGWRARLQTEAACTLRELVVLCVVTALLLFFGLVPFRIGPAVISQPAIGLVGADEPRYAQIAVEMLEEHSAVCHELNARVIPHSLRWKDIHASFLCAEGGTITPILYGHPWLEKPALYYWRTMSFYKEFGKSDWAARLSSATGAFALVFLIFLHMRRFRPGGHLDAALITASAVAIVAFARGASTDMQLAAPFCIGMLGWYAWYETGKKFWLFDLYFFGGIATLAKGPVAIFLSVSIILLFVGLRREWQVLRRMIWLPGICLFLAIVLPWFIAVQLRNPTFYKFFLFEQNLQRFASDRYQHHQNPFYYLIVLILALMPWTIVALRALWDSVDIAWAEWRVRHKPARYLGHTRAGDAFPEFLVLWAIFPVLFFSFSGSKLPGYILPSIPPITILTGDYMYRVRRTRLPRWLMVSHGVMCGLLTFVLLLCPQYMVYQRMIPATRTLIWAGSIALVTGVAIVLLTRRYGLQWLRPLTLVPVLCLLFFLLQRNGWLLDENYSARPMARQIHQMAPDVKLLVTHHIRRDTDYGLCFYRNQPLRHYLQEESATEKQSVITGVPNEEHILVIRSDDSASLQKLLPWRHYKLMFVNVWQGLAVYRVDALK